MPGDENVRSRLIISATSWDAVDQAFASLIPFDSPAENADLLTQLIATGAAAAHRIVAADGKRIGCLVTRCEVGTAGRELVVIAAFMLRDVVGSLLEPLHEAVTALAVAERCVSIRVHTCRAALAKSACATLGYRVSEIVLRKNLVNGSA